MCNGAYPPKTWVAVTPMGLSTRPNLIEWAGMGSERCSVHTTVLGPTYVVGQGAAGQWWCTCLQETFSVTIQCAELEKEWGKAGIA
jgi:hypothetical protein